MVELVHILLISIATMEQTFSIMNIIKDKFHNKIDDDILMESLILYIKRKIVTKLVHY